MDGGSVKDVAIIVLSAFFCVWTAYSQWRAEKLVRHLADLLASRSYGEWAVHQGKLAAATYVKKQEEKKSGAYTNVFDGGAAP